jgi:hypothetical protein
MIHILLNCMAFEKNKLFVYLFYFLTNTTNELEYKNLHVSLEGRRGRKSVSHHHTKS